MRALLDDVPADGRAVIDLFRGAVVAHLRPAPGCGLVAEDRLRLSAVGVLACWAAFVVAGLAFYKTVEGYPFSAADEAHPLLGDSYLAAQIAAVAASLSAVIGATPLVWAALRSSCPSLNVQDFLILPASLTGLAGAD